MVLGLADGSPSVPILASGEAPAHPQGYQSIPIPTCDGERKDESRDTQSDETKGYALVLFAALVYKCMGLLAREVTLFYGISV